MLFQQNLLLLNVLSYLQGTDGIEVDVWMWKNGENAKILLQKISERSLKVVKNSICNFKNSLAATCTHNSLFSLAYKTVSLLWYFKGVSPPTDRPNVITLNQFMPET